MTPRDVIKAVEGFYELTPGTLKARQRCAKTAKARQIAMEVMYINAMSSPKIGRALDRDHSTVIHGHKKAREKWPGEVAQLAVVAKRIEQGRLIREQCVVRQAGRLLDGLQS